MFLKVSRSPLHGHGCFTTRQVAAGEVVAQTRLLLFPPVETKSLLGTSLKNYLFFVRDSEAGDELFHAALAMGPVSFCNHSTEPNCDFVVDETAGEITFRARRDLRENEEITIDYGDYAGEIV